METVGRVLEYRSGERAGDALGREHCQLSVSKAIDGWRLNLHWSIRDIAIVGIQVKLVTSKLWHRLDWLEENEDHATTRGCIY